MILVTGALGQIGTELVIALQEKYGKDKIIASDLKEPENYDGKFVKCDVTNFEAYEEINEKNGIKTVYHLAAILSATGEKNPELCKKVNVNGLENGGKWPFIWSVACVNGEFHIGPCFAETWLRATGSDGSPTGALATLMSTVNQGWNPPMAGQDEMNAILAESY